MAMKMYCPECGAAVEEGSICCSQCGTKIDMLLKQQERKNNDKGKSGRCSLSKKASGAFWNRLFSGMMFLLLIPWVLYFASIFSSDTLMWMSVSVIGFLIALFAISGAMVFVSMAKNVEKITNYLPDLRNMQEVQADELRKLAYKTMEEK